MRALLFAAGLLSVAAPAVAQTPRPDPGPLTIARQGSFFIGGRDVKSDTLSTLPAYAASGTITVDRCMCTTRSRSACSVSPSP
jgi:hypothetical protein